MNDLENLMSQRKQAYIENYNDGIDAEGHVKFWKLPKGSLMFRTIHNLLGKGFSASDIDLVLMDELCDGGIVAFIEHKHVNESISYAQTRLFNELSEQGYDVYIIISYFDYTQFDIRQYQPGKSPAYIAGCHSTAELGDWEIELRKNYCRRKR